MSEGDPRSSPDALLPYFERFAQGPEADDEYVRGVAIIRRWQALAARQPLDATEFNRLVEFLESEPNPGSGWYDLWKRTIAWGEIHRLTEPRANPWAKP